ncbi:arylamine N-acetyltransferase family protein [Vibrio gallicus]|uniref:arylamine N-acetyltransferase family protein n=1 Tax=Vibrio gallicus TaxID=190897 RepID=UPI0021C45BBB|nr:arylamine N-acetyltransferase [Vibrio gallicus]
MDTQTLTAYLKRIQLDKTPNLSVTFLHQLHNAHHRTIPFENFNVIDNSGIYVDQQSIIDKLISNLRGGYCFEVNGLMFYALQAMGFTVQRLLGRVHLTGTASGRSHQVSLVTIDNQQWLVDVGFGSHTPRKPIAIELDVELKTDNQTFRFIRDAQFGIMLQIQDNEQWQSLYSLDMGYVCQGDIEVANHYTSTHCDSVFNSACIAAIATANGSATLLNERLKITNNGEITETLLTNQADFMVALKEYFGLDLTDKVDSITKFVEFN